MTTSTSSAVAALYDIYLGVYVVCMYWLARTPWGWNVLTATHYLMTSWQDWGSFIGLISDDIWWYLMISTVRYGRLDVLTLHSLSGYDNIIFCQGELSTTVIVKDTRDWFFLMWLTFTDIVPRLCQQNTINPIHIIKVPCLLGLNLPGECLGLEVRRDLY